MHPKDNQPPYTTISFDINKPREPKFIIPKKIKEMAKKIEKKVKINQIEEYKITVSDEEDYEEEEDDKMNWMEYDSPYNYFCLVLENS